MRDPASEASAEQRSKPPPSGIARLGQSPRSQSRTRSSLLRRQKDHQSDARSYSEASPPCGGIARLGQSRPPLHPIPLSFPREQKDQQRESMFGGSSKPPPQRKSHPLAIPLRRCSILHRGRMDHPRTLPSSFTLRTWTDRRVHEVLADRRWRPSSMEARALGSDGIQHATPFSTPAR